MSPSDLARFIRLGQQADPVILDALSRGAPSEFRPALSYHFEVAGKRMRAAMVVLSCAAAGGRVERAIKPAAVVEMIHNYSLVMDDLIEDLPANRNVRKVAVKTMKEIIDGERLDLLLEQAGRTDPYLMKNRISNPTFKTYLDMVGKKTASLFKAAGQIGAYAANAETRIVNALGTYGWKAGLAFQVMDDVLDICGEKTGKQQAKDIIEHKLGNAAILIALRFLSRKDREELKKIIGSERVSTQMLKKARSMVNKTPAERECREIAMKYLEDAKASLSVLKPSPFKDALSDLADQVVARSY